MAHNDTMDAMTYAAVTQAAPTERPRYTLYDAIRQDVNVAYDTGTQMDMARRERQRALEEMMRQELGQPEPRAVPNTWADTLGQTPDHEPRIDPETVAHPAYYHDTTILTALCYLLYKRGLLSDGDYQILSSVEDKSMPALISAIIQIADLNNR